MQRENRFQVQVTYELYLEGHFVFQHVLDVPKLFQEELLQSIEMQRTKGRRERHSFEANTKVVAEIIFPECHKQLRRQNLIQSVSSSKSYVFLKLYGESRETFSELTGSTWSIGHGSV